MTGTPSQASLTIKSGPGAGRVIDLPQGELLIGRIEPAGLVISDSEVSRRHARLLFREGKYFLEDLGSANGTILHGFLNYVLHLLHFIGSGIPVGPAHYCLPHIVMTDQCGHIDGKFQ